MSLQSAPIIRLEVEGMRRTIAYHLSNHAAQMEADILAAVDSYCTPENLAQVVQNAARQALDSAIREEVDNFFRYGNGRKAIAAAVKESILSNKTFTPLDGA